MSNILYVDTIDGCSSKHAHNLPRVMGSCAWWAKEKLRAASNRRKLMAIARKLPADICPATQIRIAQPRRFYGFASSKLVRPFRVRCFYKFANSKLDSPFACSVFCVSNAFLCECMEAVVGDGPADCRGIRNSS